MGNPFDGLNDLARNLNEAFGAVNRASWGFNRATRAATTAWGGIGGIQGNTDLAKASNRHTQEQNRGYQIATQTAMWGRNAADAGLTTPGAVLEHGNDRLGQIIPQTPNMQEIAYANQPYGYQPQQGYGHEQGGQHPYQRPFGRGGYPVGQAAPQRWQVPAQPSPDVVAMQKFAEMTLNNGQDPQAPNNVANQLIASLQKAYDNVDSPAALWKAYNHELDRRGVSDLPWKRTDPRVAESLIADINTQAQKIQEQEERNRMIEEEQRNLRASRAPNQDNTQPTSGQEFGKLDTEHLNPSNHKQVAALQQALEKAGFDVGKHGVDGRLGGNTANAIAQAEETLHVKVGTDGFDKALMAAAAERSNTPFNVASVNAPSPPQGLPYQGRSHGRGRE